MSRLTKLYGLALLLSLSACGGVKAFHNDPPSAHKNLWDVWRWQWQRHPPQWVFRTNQHTPKLAARVYQGVRITPINHATVLIQMAGLNILTDPIWSERASPVSWAGPRRFHPPALPLTQLPPIDVVLVSHNHYDHCDLPTLQALQQQFSPLFITPLGNAELIAQATGSSRIHTLDWWQTHTHGAVKLTLTPAQHWSSRFIFDRNQALWGGFMLDSGTHKVFFAGDTAWGEHFAHIRQRLGAPDVALLPIGAYLPRDFMRAQHIDPAEAVRAYQILGARAALGIHHATFQLADEGQDQAAQDLAHALALQKIAPARFQAAQAGASQDY